MTWAGTETFSSNTGQFHSPAPSLLPSSATGGTISFVGGQGVVSYPDIGGYSAQCFYIGAAGDPDDNSYVAIDIIGVSNPPSQSFDVVDVALIKDGANTVFFDAAAIITGARVGANFSGVRNYGSGVSTTSASMPYSIALSWQGNIFKTWVLYPLPTGWVQVSSWDVTALHDFTAVGGRVGWRPGFTPACQPNNATFTVDNLRWGPISDLTNGFNYLPPTNLATLLATDTAIQISWTASAAFVGSGLPPPTYYAVYRNGTRVGITIGGATNFIDNGTFAENTVYVYTVAASDSLGNPLSAQSAPLNVSIDPKFAFGGFATAATFPPIMLTNVKGIKPRIYAPIQNTTVSTKQ